MNVLIFTQKEYNKVIAIQEGQHRTASVALTNCTYFCLPLEGVPEGGRRIKTGDWQVAPTIWKDKPSATKLTINYSQFIIKNLYDIIKT
jgi:hypothetical protein